MIGTVVAAHPSRLAEDGEHLQQERQSRSAGMTSGAFVPRPNRRS
jgi:hypothetical protein